MGLLDDAIKEHLELKRRRGADAEEVTRLEQEALGPPQRGEFAAPAAPAEPADLPPVEPEPAPDTADSPVVEPEPRDDVVVDRPAVEPEPEPEPAPPVDPEPTGGVVVDQPTVEYTPPAEPEAPAEGEDVLEETPEFLAETPEHDRLWFEQKPPRDFDLDR
jgi:hypothetical protein